MALHTRNILQLGPKTIEEEGEGLHQPEARMVAISQKADSAGAVEGDGKAKDESTPKNMAESACSSKPDKQPDKSEEDSKGADLKTFRTQCEKACLFELEGRLVPLVAQGSHVEINANVTSTRLYRNMTEHVPLMAFYDSTM